jgi:hypothetical protein
VCNEQGSSSDPNCNKKYYMLALLARKICTKSLNNNMVMNLPKDTFLAGVQISPRRQMRQQSAKGGKKVDCTPVGTAQQHN